MNSAAATSTLEGLRAANPGLALFGIEDSEFAEFGRVIRDLPTALLVDWMTPNVPIGEDVAYQRSVPSMEELPLEGFGTWKRWASAKFFGGQEAEIGWVAGRNSRLNAFEYHKSSELLVAGTDLVLLLGRLSELEDFSRFDSSRAKAFFLKSGTAVELYGTTLHFSPLMAALPGFRAAIILPLGTNAPLDAPDARLPGEEGLLWAERKWLLACPGSKPALAGARVGMENVELRLG